MNKLIVENNGLRARIKEIELSILALKQQEVDNERLKQLVLQKNQQIAGLNYEIQRLNDHLEKEVQYYKDKLEEVARIQGLFPVQKEAQKEFITVVKVNEIKTEV